MAHVLRWSVAGALLAACASHPGPVASPTAPAASAAAEAAPAATGDGSRPTPLPVEAPDSLLLEARSRPIAAVAKELGAIVGLPLEAIVSWMGPAALRQDAGLGAVVMLGAQTEALSLPPVLTAFSVPVVSDAAFASAMERERGAWRAELGGYRALRGPLEGLFCRTFVALGDAPLRAVCGPGEADVNQTAHYLTRGLTLADLGDGDLRVRLRVNTIKQRTGGALEDLKRESSGLGGLSGLLGGLGAMGALGGGGGGGLAGLADPALLEAPGAILDEGTNLLSSIEGVTMGVKIEGDRGRLRFDGQLALSGRSSWFVRLLTSRGDAHAVPDVFWRLPRTSEVALHGNGVDETLLEKPRRVTRTVLGLGMRYADLDAGDRRAFDEALASIPRADVPWAMASVDAPEGKPGGWWLLGIEADKNALPTWVRRVGQAGKRAMALGAKVGGSEWKDARPVLRVEDHPGGFPAGSVLVEFTADHSPSTGALSSLGGLASGGLGGLGDLGDLGALMPDLGLPKMPSLPKLPTPSTPTRSGPVRILLVAVPDGTRSWLAVGGERKALREAVQQATGARSEQLATRDGLDPLRQEQASFGGMVVPGLSLTRALKQAGKGDAVAGSPKRLTTPIVLFGSAGAKGLGVKAVVQQETLQDLVKMARP